MNQEILYVVLIIALGYLLKRFNIIEVKDGEVIAKLIFRITLPALILVTFDSVIIETSLIMLPALVILFGLVTAGVGLLVFKKEERELKGSFLMLTGFNVGLFAFPIVHAIWGQNGLKYFSLFDVGTSFLVFGIAYISGSYFSKEGLSLNPKEILKKLGRSIPLMTYLVAILLNLGNIHLPDEMIQVADKLAKANMPLSLLLLGLYLDLRLDRKLLKPIAKFLAFRYGLGLAVGLPLFLFLPYDQMFRTTILLGLLLPCAAAPLTFAVEFKYKTAPLIATISNITILISIGILFVFANFFI